MGKEIIDGWHRSCAEDLPDYEDVVLCVLCDVDGNGISLRTEDPPIFLNWRTRNKDVTSDPFGWVEPYEECKVAYWCRIPNLPEKFIKEMLQER